jgi:hypothetical protein
MIAQRRIATNDPPPLATTHRFRERRDRFPRYHESARLLPERLWLFTNQRELSHVATIASPALALPAIADPNGPNPDAELLRLGVELEAVSVDWHAQGAIDRKDWADVDAALEAAGLPDINYGSLPDDEYRAYQLKRAAATDRFTPLAAAWTNTAFQSPGPTFTTASFR